MSVCFGGWWCHGAVDPEWLEVERRGDRFESNKWKGDEVGREVGETNRASIVDPITCQPRHLRLQVVLRDAFPSNSTCRT